MLGKLIKYEFKATSRLLMPLLICVLVLGLAGGCIANIQARIIESENPGCFDEFFEEARDFFRYANDPENYGFGNEEYDDEYTVPHGYDEDDSHYMSQVTYAAKTANTASSEMKALLISVMMSFLFLMVFGLMFCPLINLILLGYRFYKNMFTDEGYLTFTLPVTVTQNLWAKLLVGSLWQILAGLASMAAVALIFIGGVGLNPLVNMSNLQMLISGIIGLIFQVPAEQLAGLWLLTLEGLAEIIISIPAGLLMLYLAITLGCQIAKKHKVLASIGMYFAVSTAHSVLSYLIQLIFLFPTMAALETFRENSLFFAGCISLLPSLLLSIISTVICFLWSRQIMKHKLNLE